MMRAVVVEDFGSSDVLRVRAWPAPHPGPGEVRIRVSLASVNYADVLSRRGGYDAGRSVPFVPGLDCVGIVDAVGEGVEASRVGQRVAAFAKSGSYAEFALASAVLTYPVPNDLPDEAVCGLTALVTAYNVLTLAGRSRKGESVLVHAASGGVGGLAVQIARALGASPVIGVTSGSKAAFVRGLGADVVVDRGAEDFAARTLEATGGRGADVILDSVGGETLERGVTCLAEFGRLVTFGQTGGRSANVGTSPLHRGSRAVVGYSSGHLRRVRPHAVGSAVDAAFELLRRGDVTPSVFERFALERGPEAHALMERAEHVGKLVLMPSAD
ncbi:quinone oxidoreductase family protein [Deinococcus yavapaiensis]|uniref:NADPH:quinone reductase-like Zn-dependent oxidoreductase n=1 Tax=Deinococcus yavapaiensis KR-236 TaxID=694435 RepID=A0A318S8T9_9DEIO|nr:zinc-binding dehydrogenase [Deinococcus yavapaiensis]PYE55457.1 NADPH:quinone reductase-like Zn-dependent oxidoreductase [Deinococcus yavapaiensis KR-236]